MRFRRLHSFLTVVFAFSCVSLAAADPPRPAGSAAEIAEFSGTQQMVELPVRVVNAEGEPVANARIMPWALRSSQGHGLWSVGDTRAQAEPQQVVTDEDGLAVVLYPYFRDVGERVRTIGVSLQVDHPKFAYRDDLHIDVPLETEGPHQIELAEGIPVDVRPEFTDDTTGLDGVFARWSDGRSWTKGAEPQRRDNGTLRIPAMPPGPNSVMLVKLDDQRATHFSRIVDFELEAGAAKQLDVKLEPAITVRGALSDNVPRPVRDGRMKARTLQPSGSAHERVEWFTWVPIAADGTFVIAGWPAGERLQVIAMCDGFIATSGQAPDVVENPRDPQDDPFGRPQVFASQADDALIVHMTPMTTCVATLVNDEDEPVAGVRVVSWPNVAWWNGGSQLYCHPLVRGERLLKVRDYRSAVDEDFPQPFEGESGADGRAELHLPVGEQILAIRSDVYELPAFLGRRRVEAQLRPAETTSMTLHLQPRGTEQLGEWDKLAGVVFGCSTREGRRICALPQVRQKVEDLNKRFREAKNPRDPKFLAEAYGIVADAFVNVGDIEEAAKWRKRAAEQAARVTFPP